MTAEISGLEARKLAAMQAGDPRRAQEIGAEIRERRSKLERREEARQRDSPSRLLVAMPRSLAEIQKQLDAETLLLAFSLGDQRSWLWQVTDKEAELVERPPRRQIESMASRVHELIRKSGDPAVEGPLDEALEALSELLFSGVELHRPRLAIVAEGALLNTPIAALRNVSGPNKDEFLLDRHQMISLPSASILVSLRKSATKHRTADGLLAIFADPVFSLDDDRVEDLEGRTRKPAWRFQRLPATATEASRLLDLTRGHHVEIYQDFDVERDRLYNPRLADFRWLHFATHAFIDSRFPRQSGLILSLVDEVGRATNGLIRPDEIAGLDLPAELVTLSACETALTRDGGVGTIAQAFFSAGASRVIATLWEIEDSEVTVRLVESLYRGLMAGLPPPEALRAAQLELRRDGVPPAHWAPFILLGPWDPLAPIG